MASRFIAAPSAWAKLTMEDYQVPVMLASAKMEVFRCGGTLSLD
jgi:hypothetical protein